MTELKGYSLRMGVEGAMSETASCSRGLLALVTPGREKWMKRPGMASLGKYLKLNSKGNLVLLNFEINSNKDVY